MDAERRGRRFLSDWAMSIMFLAFFLIIMFVVMERRRGRRKRGRVLEDKDINYFNFLYLIIVISFLFYFIGFFTVIKLLVILLVILNIIKKIDKYYYDSIPLKAMRVMLMFIMMIFSLLAIVLSTFIVSYLIDLLAINIAIVKWFGIFEKNEIVVSANSIFVFIIIIFPPAYYIYSFIRLVSTSLLERWFSKDKIFTDVIKSYNEKILLANFTIITVFMGFLPIFAGGIIADEETKKVIDELSLIFLMLSLLPTANLLFRQAKK